jgi:hypothetical protein
MVSKKNKKPKTKNTKSTRFCAKFAPLNYFGG